MNATVRVRMTDLRRCSVADTSELMVLSCGCGHRMTVPADAMGRTFKCGRCGGHVKATEDNVAPLPKPPARKEPAQAPPETDEEDGVGPPEAQAPIGQLFVDAGLINEEQLNEALSKQKVQGGKTFEILIALGYMDKEQLHSFLSRQPGIASIDLARVNISPELVQLIPKRLAVDNLVLPIDQLGKLLTVAMACPLDVGTIRAIEKETGLRVKAMLCRLEEIHEAVQKYYPERKTFELSPSSFDHLPGASSHKEKVEQHLKTWDGMLMSAERIKEISEKIAPDAVSLDLVVALALSDPGFCAILLRVANSEPYGMRGQVDSVPMAVALLGKPMVQRLLDEILEPGDPRGLELIRPWQDLSLRTGQIAQELSKECGFIGPHAAYTLGVLSDLGRLALAMVAPLQYKRVKPNLYGEQLAQAEQRLFTMDHCETAGQVGLQWHLPVSITRPLQYYLSPADAQEMEPQARLLDLASGLAHMKEASIDKKLAAYGASVQKLGVAPDIIERISKMAL